MTIPRPLLITLAGLCVMLAAGIGVFAAVRDHRVLPPPAAIGGPFRLTATDGTTVTDQTYAGRWELIYFGYTGCPDACPTALADVSGALQALGPTAAKLQPIFITVDPARDTRSVLASYLKSFDARIVGLTGSEQETRAAAAAYRIVVKPGADELIDHSAYLYVMDPAGRFVDVIDGSTPGNDIAATVRKILDHYL